MERGDLLALGDLARDAKAPGPAPATGSGGAGLVEALLGIDEDVGQLLVGGGPGVDHRVGGDLLAQHLADGPQQATADDRVMLGQDLQRDVLVDDLANQRA